MDAFGRFLELDDALLRRQLSPQEDRAPPEPALLRQAIVFDQPLDARDAGARVGEMAAHHAISVLPTAMLGLSSSAQYGVETSPVARLSPSGPYAITSSIQRASHLSYETRHLNPCAATVSCGTQGRSRDGDAAR